jgi:predicted TIM-barrel fold metal-dependent hydrolase
MVIDFHTHILPKSFQKKHHILSRKDQTFSELFSRNSSRIVTAEELIGSMDLNQITKSVVLGYGWCDLEIAKEANNYLLEAAQRFPERLIPFCSVNPEWGDKGLDEIDRCVSGGAKGIGEIHASIQGIDLATSLNLDNLMTVAIANRLPLLIHGSEPVGHLYPGKGSTTPPALLNFIDRFPSAIIICAHWGGGLPFYGLMPEVKEKLVNVFFDTAASPFLYSPKIFNIVSDIIGSNHILFGSDYPLISADRIMDQIRTTLTSEAASAILERNAQKLLEGSEN